MSKIHKEKIRDRNSYVTVPEVVEGKASCRLHRKTPSEYYIMLNGKGHLVYGYWSDSPEARIS